MVPVLSLDFEAELEVLSSPASGCGGLHAAGSQVQGGAPGGRRPTGCCTAPRSSCVGQTVPEPRAGAPGTAGGASAWWRRTTGSSPSSGCGAAASPHASHTSHPESACCKFMSIRQRWWLLLGSHHRWTSGGACPGPLPISPHTFLLAHSLADLQRLSAAFLQYVLQ